MRLSNATLSQVPAAIPRPGYDRSRVVPSIVHLGLGAFNRAHQAVYTDAVLSAGDLGWGIIGAGLMSGGTKAALAPQDGLYVLAEMGADGEADRIIGSIVEVLGPDDTPALLARMSAASTRIVTITVTEKGYYLDAAGELQLQAPAIAADLATPTTPRTILGLIAQALKLRRAAGIKAFTVLSCDNLRENGKRAKAAVLAYARALDHDLATWIEANATFPCTMVDRITPATTDADRVKIATTIGMEDAWPVVTEQFTQWVIEDQFTMGRPDWTIGGAVFSNEIDAWENVKLRCLNGAHSTLAYLGQLTGCETVADAMKSSLITDELDALWAEIRAVLRVPKGLDPNTYIDSLKQRFRNPALKHRTAQIAMDGSQKLPIRLLTPLRERTAKGLESPAIATAIAAWMHYVVRIAQDSGCKLHDPLAAEIMHAANMSENAATIVANLLALEKIFGSDLPADFDFKAAVTAKFIDLAQNPAVAAAPGIKL